MLGVLALRMRHKVGGASVSLTDSCSKLKKSDEAKCSNKEVAVTLVGLYRLDINQVGSTLTLLPGSAYFSNAKIFFQSFFMSTTVQPLACASSSPLSSRPVEDWRS